MIDFFVVGSLKLGCFPKHDALTWLPRASHWIGSLFLGLLTIRCIRYEHIMFEGSLEV